MSSSHSLDRIAVTFDDDHAVATAGLLLTATLGQHLDLEAVIDDCVDLGDRPGYFRPGRKVMTLIDSMIAGGDFIDDADVLRVASTASVLGHRVMAPSTLGTFLRSFTFGNIRQLDRAAEIALGRAWAAGAGPGDDAVTIDIDSTICEVYGYDKEGAAFGYTKVRGFHPMVATRSGTGEVLHSRFRKGSANTARGAQRFVRETVGRVRRAGATGPLSLRADSGYWSAKVIEACRDHKVSFSVTVRQTAPVKAAIAAIDEGAWTRIAGYPEPGVAEVAETTMDGTRLIVRRVSLVDPATVLVPLWRYHGFVTDIVGDTVTLDANHRRHAVVELVVRELKAGGWAHCPSGDFDANGAWSLIATLAHNLLRWSALIGEITDGPLVAKTLRRRHITLPGRLTRSARLATLHLPRHWPWQKAFSHALVRLRAVRLAT
jgi:hypothetical protein